MAARVWELRSFYQLLNNSPGGRLQQQYIIYLRFNLNPFETGSGSLQHSAAQSRRESYRLAGKSFCILIKYKDYKEVHSAVHAHRHNPSTSKPTGRFLDDSGSITRPKHRYTYNVIQVDSPRMFTLPSPLLSVINICIYSNSDFWNY